MAAAIPPLLRRVLVDPDLALDLGTSGTRAVGGRCRPVEVGTPRGRDGLGAVRRGVVTDPGAVVRLLTRLLARWHRVGRRRPRVLLSLPTGLSPRRQRRLVEVVREAGAAAVETVPAPLAAALGAGLDLSLPHAQMVVDVGEGLTEMAAVREGSLLAARALAVGCRDLGEPGAAPAALARLAEGVRAFWGSLPLRAQVEVIEGGLLVTGGGALREGLLEAVGRTCRLPVRCPREPRQAVIRGLAAFLGAWPWRQEA